MMHGLGLAHPFDDGFNSEIMNGVKDLGGDVYSSGKNRLNRDIYTVMSYNDEAVLGIKVPEPAGRAYGNVASPMALDLGVLDRLYGLKDSVKPANSTYELPGRNKVGTYFETIYDTGGKDTIRAASNGKDAKIYLKPATLKYESGGGGTLSFTEGVTGGFTIAKGVRIENARGGDGNDTLYGNKWANRLFGNIGEDTLVGNGGNDVLRGDAATTF